MRRLSARFSLLTLLVLVVLVAAACSDDGDDSAEPDGSDTTQETREEPAVPSVPTTDELPIGTEEDLKAALAESIAPVGGDTEFDEATTACLVDSILESVGYDRWIELGVRPGNVATVDPLSGMTEEEKIAYIDALAACTSLRDLAVATLGFAPPLDQCIDDAIPDEAAARAILIYLLASDDTGAPPTGQVGEAFDSLEVCRSELLEGPAGD